MGESFELVLDSKSRGLLWAYEKIRKAQDSGVLTLEWDRYKKQILFKNGLPLVVKSNWPQESFGTFLVRSKRLDSEVVRQELAEMEEAEFRTGLGEWLVSKNLIAGHEMPELLQAHFRERLFNQLGLTRGNLRFKHSAEFAETNEGTRLTEAFEKLLWNAAKLTLTVELCREKLSGHLNRSGKLRVTEFPLPLAGQDFKIWNQLMAKDIAIKTLDEASMKMMAVAQEFDLIEWTESSEEKMISDLKKTWERVKKAAPHDALGVNALAPVEECKKAFLGIIKKYHPDRLGTADPEAKKLAEQIFAKMNDAHQIMTDPTQRPEYEAQVELDKAGGVEALQQRLEAEMMIPQIKMAIKRKQFKTALEQIDKALQALSGDLEMICDKILCEFQIAVEEKKEIRLKSANWKMHLQKIIEQKKDFAPAYYTRALIYKAEGLTERALTDFDQAVELNEDLVEAASEARVLRMRKDKEASGGGFFGNRSSKKP